SVQAIGLPEDCGVGVVGPLYLPEVAVAVVDVLDRKARGVDDRVDATCAVVACRDGVAGIGGEGDAGESPEAVVGMRARVVVSGRSRTELAHALATSVVSPGGEEVRLGTGGHSSERVVDHSDGLALCVD